MKITLRIIRTFLNFLNMRHFFPYQNIENLFFYVYNRNLTELDQMNNQKGDLKVNFIKFLPFLLMALSTISCSRNYIQKMLVEHPEILSKAIEENPEQIIMALNNASVKMREQQMRAAQEEKSKQAEEEYANPKQPDTPESRNYFGNVSAPITIVEYSDFQCGFCKRAHDQTLTQILRDYDGKVRILYKHLPILHSTSHLAAQYYEAVVKVDKQKAKGFHDKLFEDPSQIRQGADFLDKVVDDLGMSVKKVKDQLESVNSIIENDKQEAQKFGFSGTLALLSVELPFEELFL